MDFQRAAQNRLKNRDRSERPSDPRGKQGIYSRGMNVYNGGSNSAHSGGGPQFGRPRTGFALGRVLPGSGREQAPGQNRPMINIPSLPTSGRNQVPPPINANNARFSPDAIRRALSVRRGF